MNSFLLIVSFDKDMKEKIKCETYAYHITWEGLNSLSVINCKHEQRFFRVACCKNLCRSRLVLMADSVICMKVVPRTLNFGQPRVIC